MYKQLKKDKGFTIIEVLIVLAIAGLILLIVFLAVPALQRNARNTQIKSDASAIAAAVTEFESNNSGSLPSNTTAETGPTINMCADIGCAVAGQGVVAGAKVQGSTSVTFGAVPGAGPAANTVYVQFTGACPGTTATARTTAISYPIETGTGISPTAGCIQS